jgi:hypothetical protein
MTPEEKDIWNVVFGARVANSDSIASAIEIADHEIKRLRRWRVSHPTAGFLVTGDPEPDKEGKEKP